MESSFKKLINQRRSDRKKQASSSETRSNQDLLQNNAESESKQDFDTYEHNEGRAISKSDINKVDSDVHDDKKLSKPGHPSKLDKDQTNIDDRVLHVRAEYKSIIDTSEPKDIQEQDLSNLDWVQVLNFNIKQSKSDESSKVREKETVSLENECKQRIENQSENIIDISLDPRFCNLSFRKSMLEWAQDKQERKGINVLDSLTKIGAIKGKINLVLDIEKTMVHSQKYSTKNEEFK